jgi:hypothetical protein
MVNEESKPPRTQTMANGGKDVEEKEPFTLLVGMQIPMQPLWKTVWEKKTPKNRTAI